MLRRLLTGVALLVFGALCGRFTAPAGIQTIIEKENRFVEREPSCAPQEVSPGAAAVSAERAPAAVQPPQTDDEVIDELTRLPISLFSWTYQNTSGRLLSELGNKFGGRSLSAVATTKAGLPHRKYFRELSGRMHEMNSSWRIRGNWESAAAAGEYDLLLTIYKNESSSEYCFSIMGSLGLPSGERPRFFPTPCLSDVVLRDGKYFVLAKLFGADSDRVSEFWSMAEIPIPSGQAADLEFVADGTKEWTKAKKTGWEVVSRENFEPIFQAWSDEDQRFYDREYPSDGTTQWVRVEYDVSDE
jgi:hypothetical protein